MPTELKMPALSPTMEEGTLAKWLVKVGDTVKSGDLMAEIETDKATMEFEAVDEGVITDILVAEGTDGVKVGAVIALIQGEDDGPAPAPKVAVPAAATAPKPEPEVVAATPAPAVAPAKSSGDRVKASPLAKRIAAEKGVDLTSVTGTGPNGRIVKADLDGAKEGARPAPGATATQTASTPTPAAAIDTGIPHDRVQTDCSAYLFDRRCPPRRAAQAARRAQRVAGGAWRQAVGQRHADQGARPGAHSGAQMQCQLCRRQYAAIQPRRYQRRGIGAHRPDYAHRHRRREQVAVENLE
jgi:pyruvate/2-oxoglutarate dehydrogenase complex dihydrolipoamide acyltransferase (E2) component